MGKIVLKQLQGLSHQVHSAPFPELAMPLGVQLSSAGYEYRPPGDDYDWHGLQRGERAIVLLQYTIDGGGLLRWEDQEHTVQAGQLMLLCIPHDHRYHLPPGQSWEHIYMTLSGDEAWRMTQYLLQRHGPLISIDPEDQSMVQFSRLIRLVHQQRIDYAEQASALLYGVFMQLLGIEHRQHVHPEQAAIQEAMRFAREHLAFDIGIQEMADAAGMSRYHFSRLFKSINGMSPGQWLTRQRVHAAADLLLHADMPMARIAERCGFSDVNYFGKVFKRAQGISPGQFRDSGLFG